MTKLYPTKSEYELLWITKGDEQMLFIANIDYEGLNEAAEQLCIACGGRTDIVPTMELMMALEPDHFAERVFAMLYRAEMDGKYISGYPDEAQYDSVTLCRRVTAYQCPPKCHKCGVYYKEELVEGIDLSKPQISIEYALDILHSMLQMADVIAHTGEADKVTLNSLYGVCAFDDDDRSAALQMAIDALEERRREEVRDLDGRDLTG